MPFEVLVVIDGSTDQTERIAREFSGMNVRVVLHPTKLGKGGAVMRGFAETLYPSVGFVDADGPIEPEDLLSLIAGLSEADCVVASRWVKGSAVRNRQPTTRVVLGKLWSFAVRGVLLLKVRDTQCGAKFFRKTVIDSVGKSVAVSDWAFDASLLFHIRESGYTIREIPVTWSNKDGSKLVVARALPVMLISLLGIRLMNGRVGLYLPKTIIAWAHTWLGSA